jgi:hypothetical protein
MAQDLRERERAKRTSVDRVEAIGHPEDSTANVE